MTPTQQMLGEPVTPPPAASPLAVSDRPLTGPLMIAGLAPGLMHDVETEAARFGRLVITEPAGPFTSFPVQPLIPGASVAVAYSTGAIAMGAVGTVTYRDGQTVYAFGHELDAAGRRDLLLQDAYVCGVLNNPLGGSYKLAAPGHGEGTLSSDTPNAVIGTVGGLPSLVPIDVAATDTDTGRSPTLSSQVADETDVGLPLGSSIVDAVAPLQAAQAATQIYDGPPANESGSMCAQIYLRELRSPLSFCNRSVAVGPAGDSNTPALANAVGTDLANAFGALEQVRFATLHGTRVSAQIRAQRGLAEAAVVSARAPRQVRPRQLVTVHLRVRAFRGVTITVSFRLRIPRRARGRVTVRLTGPAPVTLTGQPSSNILLGERWAPCWRPAAAVPPRARAPRS